MEYRILLRDEIIKFYEIDRSEVIEHVYYHRDGKLELVEEFYDIAGFNQVEQEQLLKRQYELFDHGGIIIGAFDKAKLVGIVSIEAKLRGKNFEYVKMDLLYVSKFYRRKNIAVKLVELSKVEALKFGAHKLYISATPSENTVNFYFSLGCVLTKELDLELFKLEPEDIHLELALD